MDRFIISLAGTLGFAVGSITYYKIRKSIDKALCSIGKK